MAKLILIRHGKSTWNAKGLWTGWTDVPLAQEGYTEARACARVLGDIQIDKVYLSTLKRAIQTYDEIKRQLNLNIPEVQDKALNERSYGIYTGKNKWEIKREFGEKKFQKLRRSWNYPIPQGETMKDVYNRVVPYYKKFILPNLINGKNVLIVAHGNSLRALAKYLDKLTNKQLSTLEIGIGEVLVYEIDKTGHNTFKQTRLENPNKGKT